MKKMLLFFSAFYSFSSFALVGGSKSLNFDAVVSIEDAGETNCSGSVVGLKPLTIITAAHCVNSSKREDISVQKMVPTGILFGNHQLPGFDIAVLVFDNNARIPGLGEKNIFTLMPKLAKQMKSYRGPIETCGFGKQVSNYFSSESIGERKCGQGLYLEGDSYSDAFHTLYSKQFMNCYIMARPDEYRKLDFAKTLSGDSGGPLFRKINGKLVLIGVTNSVSFNISHENANSKDCGVPYGYVYRMKWSSVLNSNKVSTVLFTLAKTKMGADISGF